MLRMAQIQYIKDQYENEEVSLREISRKTGHSFETVRKYAYQEDWREDRLPDIEPKSYPVLEDYIPVTDQWLEADRKVPRKQRHTSKRIYDRLREEHGFAGSYSSVKRYVRKKKYVVRAKESGYLPLAHTRFFRQMPEQWQSYLSLTQGKERKSALRLLKEIVDDGNAFLCDDALELAASNGRTDADSLRQCYYMIAKKEYRPDPLKLSSAPMLNYDPSLTVYDSLTGGGARV